MKKLLSLLLIFSLLIPVFAFADDPDPIVGCWYIFIDSDTALNSYKDLGYIYSFMLFIFMEDGRILYHSLDITSEYKGEANDLREIGKWMTNDAGYTVSVLGVGTHDALLEDDKMSVCLFNDGTYHTLRKMTSFDFYSEIKYE